MLLGLRIFLVPLEALILGFKATAESVQVGNGLLLLQFRSDIGTALLRSDENQFATTLDQLYCLLFRVDGKGGQIAFRTRSTERDDNRSEDLDGARQVGPLVLVFLRYLCGSLFRHDFLLSGPWDQAFVRYTPTTLLWGE